MYMPFKINKKRERKREKVLENKYIVRLFHILKWRMNFQGVLSNWIYDLERSICPG